MKIIPGSVEPSHLSIFVALSIALHLVAFWALSNLDAMPINVFARGILKEEKTIVVEVVDLPPEPAGRPIEPEDAARHARRSQTVEREESPEPGSIATRRAASPQRSRTKAAKVVKVVAPPSLQKESAGESQVAAEAKTMDSADLPLKQDGIFRTMEKSKAIGTAKDGSTSPAGSGESERENSSTGEAGAKTFSLMPSEEKLERIASSRETVRVRGVEKLNRGKKLLLNTSNFKFYKYFNTIKQRIEFYWEFPLIAARDGQQGRLQIEFVINKDGTVKKDGIRLVKSSNYPMLDDAAIRKSVV